MTEMFSSQSVPEARAQAQGPSAQVFQASRTDLHLVLRQTADVIVRTGEGGVEINLSPEELGRVRMQMVPGDGGLVIHITADRVDTLDLMRRNIDQLARDLADAGYGGTEFTFGNGTGGQDDRTSRGSPASRGPEPAVPEPAQPPASPNGPDGLDIRI